METTEYVNELDQLLQKAVERGEALKMPPKKEHPKTRRKRLLERSRRAEKTEAMVAYRERQRKALRYKYNHLRRAQVKAGIEWELSLGEWLLAWTLARPASRGHIPVPAWQARGKQKDDVKFLRKNKRIGYRLDNIMIVQGNVVLYP